MRLVTYRSDLGLRAGFLVGEVVVDAENTANAAGFVEDVGPVARSVRELLAAMDGRLSDLAAAAAEQAAAGNGIRNFDLAAPVPDPAKVLCLGLNYRLHADEFNEVPPEIPNVFAKFPNSLIGPRDPIRVPPTVHEVDFEGELAVVIGRECRRVREDEALRYVAGCTVFNDVTGRELQRRTSQWTAGKAIDTFAPSGPSLVSLDEVGDLQTLRLRTTLNDELMQDASIAEMIHPVPEAIAFLSSLMTLMPGNIIATGTPHGVGARRDPPVFMEPGDVVQVEIDGLGRTVNQVAAESPAN